MKLTELSKSNSDGEKQKMHAKKQLIILILKIKITPNLFYNVFIFLLISFDY